ARRVHTVAVRTAMHHLIAHRDQPRLGNGRAVEPHFTADAAHGTSGPHARIAYASSASSSHTSHRADQCAAAVAPVDPRRRLLFVVRRSSISWRSGSIAAETTGARLSYSNPFVSERPSHVSVALAPSAKFTATASARPDSYAPA